MGFAGFIPRGDEGSCWEAKCNVGPNTCLIRHAEGYFNLVSAGRGGCGARKRRPRLLDTQLCTIWVRVCGGGCLWPEKDRVLLFVLFVEQVYPCLKNRHFSVLCIHILLIQSLFRITHILTPDPPFR